MTIRTRTVGAITTHAGPAMELAELALKYAADQCGKDAENASRRFESAAAALKTGHVAERTDGIGFWPDGPDGAPFCGNRDYMPPPDPAWLAAKARADQNSKL